VSTEVETSVDGHVALCRLNRPEARNALSPELMNELASAVEGFDADQEVRCIVIAGSDEAFAAGADIKAMSERSHQDVMLHSTTGSWQRLWGCRTPLVAAVSGFALGGGCELALACDFRVAAATAKLGQPEILLGIIPGGGGTQRLPRLVGPARAKEIIFSGRQVPAEEALAIGLVDKVVAPDELLAAAVAWAAELASGATAAQGLAKRAVDGGLDGGLADGVALEQELFTEVFRTDDAGIGIESFREHGPGKARFSGR
jgi:enoyl-CoA hydratase/carnithine racemase